MALVIIRNTSFYNNTSNDGGIFFILENPLIENNNVIIDSSFFEENAASLSLFVLEACSFQMSNSVLKNNFNKVFDLSNSQMFLQNITLIDQNCNSLIYGCIVNTKGNSIIFMENNKFYKILSRTEGNIYMLESKIMIQNSNFNKVLSDRNIGSCIYATASEIKIFNSNFTNISASCLFLTMSNFSMNGSIFDNNMNFSSSNEFGGLFCGSCFSFFLFQTIFKNQIFGKNGGSIQTISNEEFQNNDFLIENCTFNKNNASNFGGALYILNVNFTISYCLFEENSANQAGAIFYDVTLQNSHLNLKNNSFFGNIGYSEGGAIKWTFIEPNFLSSNYFQSNKALYGTNIAAMPIKINMKILTNDNKIMFDNNNQRLIEISSGSIINYAFIFEILDVYDNVVTIIDSTK